MKDSVEKLIPKIRLGEQAKLKILYNATVATATAYRSESTERNLNNWRAAENACQEEIDRLNMVYGEINTAESLSWKKFENTKNKADVYRYLRETGWQVSERTFYRHVSDGKLKKNRDGLYTAAAVKKYAETWSTRPSGKTVVEEEENLAAMKTRAEIDRIKTTQQREQFRLDVEKGKYLLRDTVDMELAGRAVALEAGFDHLIYTRAAEWIALVGGTQDKTDLLIASLMAVKNEWLGSYAAPMEYSVTMVEK
jgi:hypothetical protein